MATAIFTRARKKKHLLVLLGAWSEKPRGPVLPFQIPDEGKGSVPSFDKSNLINVGLKENLIFNKHSPKPLSLIVSWGSDHS